MVDFGEVFLETASSPVVPVPILLAELTGLLVLLLLLLLLLLLDTSQVFASCSVFFSPVLNLDFLLLLNFLLIVGAVPCTTPSVGAVSLVMLLEPLVCATPLFSQVFPRADAGGGGLLGMGVTL